jgi:hypothetical protein
MIVECMPFHGRAGESSQIAYAGPRPPMVEQTARARRTARRIPLFGPLLSVTKGTIARDA